MSSPDVFVGRIALTAVDVGAFLEDIPKQLSAAEIQKVHLLQNGTHFILLFEEVKEGALFRLKNLLRAKCANRVVDATTFGAGTSLTAIERNAYAAEVIAASAVEEATPADIEAWFTDDSQKTKNQ